MNATKLCVISAYLLLFMISALPQEKTITGTIASQGGLPLPGFNILIENTAKATQSDFVGNYTIGAGIGQEPLEVVIKGVPFFFMHQLIHHGTVASHYTTVSHNKVLKG